MIKFCCKKCGQRFQVADKNAGKHANCPKCKNILTIPTVEKNLAIELEPHKHQQDQEDYFKYQDSIINANKAEDAEIQTERRLPWIIDIFLYPFSKPGLVMLGIFIGIPLFISLLGEIVKVAVISFPPLVVIFFALGVISILIRLILIFYGYWYICECVRDSAEGSIRASETASKTPGLWELICQFFNILLCFIVFAAPSLFYWRYTGNIDIIFWIIIAATGFCFPMALLAVIMFDSLRGLNPLLVIPSIFSSFIPYCGLILFGAVMFYLFEMLIRFLIKIPFLGYPSMFLSIYALMIEAHLLGRFYFRHRDKLYWEV